jgi:hypothetical protein
MQTSPLTRSQSAASEASGVYVDVSDGLAREEKQETQEEAMRREILTLETQLDNLRLNYSNRVKVQPPPRAQPLAVSTDLSSTPSMLGAARPLEPVKEMPQLSIKPKINDPSVFTGKPYTIGSSEQSVDEWLEYLERYMRVTGVNLTTYCDFALFWLGGAALTFMTAEMSKSELRNVTIENWLNRWQLFCEKLRKQYQPYNKAQVIRDQLDRLRQGQDTVNGYLQAFIRLAGQLSSMGDEEKLAYFRRGLKPKIAVEIDRADGVMTYERATGIAAKVESAVNTLEARSFTFSNKKIPNYNRSAASSANSAAPSIQQRTQLAVLQSVMPEREETTGNDSVEEGDPGIPLNAVQLKNKKLTFAEKGKLMKEGKCFYCKEPGHLIKACPKKQTEKANKSDQGKGNAPHHQ